MQLVLHCVAENNQMAAKWDGVLISFFKKIHPPKKNQQTNRTQKIQTNQTKKQANNLSDCHYRMHAGKGEGQSQW